MRRRPLLAAAAVVVVVAAVAVAFRSTGSGSGVVGSARVGSQAPGFSTYDLAGRRVRLADAVADGPVLVNFWASWCTPCRAEFPVLARVHGHGATVLGVVFRDSASSASGFMKEFGATWPALIDPKAQIADAYGVHPKPGIPVTFAVDRAGVVRARHLGPLTDADAAQLLRLIAPH